MKEPSISIIIPIFNTECYLERCINSIINQSYNNIEILLINDGSTDNSILICEQYAIIDPRIIVIDKQNEGVSVARNLGIDKASGEYVLFVDSDDYLDITALEMFASIIKEFPQVDIIASNGKAINTNYQLKHTSEISSHPKSNIEFLKEQINNNSLRHSVPLYVFRRKLLIDKNIKFKKIKIAEDLHFMLRVLFLCETVITTDFFHYYIDIRAGSASRQKDFTHYIECVLSVLEESEKLIDGKQMSDIELLFRDYLARSYLLSLRLIKLYKKKNRKMYNINFLKRNANKSITKLLLFLFIVSPYLYFLLIRTVFGIHKAKKRVIKVIINLYR